MKAINICNQKNILLQAEASLTILPPSAAFSTWTANSLRWHNFEDFVFCKFCINFVNHFRYLYTLCLFHGTTFQDILNNEDKFDQFIRDLPQMKALQEEKEMLLTSNKSLAEYNLSQVGDEDLDGHDSGDDSD